MTGSIFLLGSTPPPMGGVSIYCARRMAQLRDNGIPCLKFDTKNGMAILSLFFYYLIYRIRNKKFLIEINTSNPMAIFAIDAFGMLRFSEFIDHNSSRRFVGDFGRSQLRKIAKKCSSIKIVNPELLEYYKNAGVIDFQNFTVFSPYIRPTDSEINNALEQHQAKLNPLIGGCERDVVLSSAGKVSLHSDHGDLYGVMLTLSIYASMIPAYPKFKFVFMIGEVDNSDLCAQAIEFSNNLSSRYNNFYLITGGVPQWPILKTTKVFLRLTRTDGDSVSVREALDFGCKVIATDVSPRPSNVMLVGLDNESQTASLLKSILDS